MLTYLKRLSVFTIALILAAGTAALAAIEVSPSSSISMETWGNNHDSIEVTATSRGPNKLSLTGNTCKSKGLVSIAGFGTESKKTEGSDRPTEMTHTVSFRMNSKKEAGECELVFSDGSEHKVVKVRIEKPER